MTHRPLRTASERQSQRDLAPLFDRRKRPVCMDCGVEMRPVLEMTHLETCSQFDPSEMFKAQHELDAEVAAEQAARRAS